MGRPSVQPLGRPPLQPFRFVPNEVAEMERLWEESKGLPSREDVRSLVQKFSNAPERAGRPLHDRQVQNWFWNKRCTLKKQAGKSAIEVSLLSAMPDEKDHKKMEFEAKSSKDNAWYDVRFFLAHRMLDSGDPEVRVRFVDFGADDDEWVNVRSSVRLRSLPCEASECVSVLPGDLILCFKEGSKQALYYDAYVIEVERRRHDIRGCRCRFLVQYEHDGSTDIVPLRKVCRRPETDYRAPATEPANDAPLVKESLSHVHSNKDDNGQEFTEDKYVSQVWV